MGISIIIIILMSVITIISILTENRDCVRLYFSVCYFLIDSVTLDVDIPVIDSNLQRYVRHCSPASLLGLKPPGLVALKNF